MLHRTGALEVVHRHGIPVTTPARTLLDLARTAPQRELEGAVEQAQLARFVTPTDLAAVLRPRCPGAARLRRALEAEPAFTRSEAEQRLLALVQRADIPGPRTNVHVGRYEVDALWEERRFVVEVDGFAFHSSRAAFERDRLRDAELQAAGYRVMRVTWRQLTERPEALTARLAVALTSAAS